MANFECARPLEGFSVPANRIGIVAFVDAEVLDGCYPCLDRHDPACSRRCHSAAGNSPVPTSAAHPIAPDFGNQPAISCRLMLNFDCNFVAAGCANPPVYSASAAMCLSRY